VPLAEKVIHLDYFIGGCDWYIAELDPEDLLGFGYGNLGDPDEAGYVSLDELEAVRIGRGSLPNGTWTGHPRDS
jgi:hypothetical protein